jgi:hypothetical protein
LGYKAPLDFGVSLVRNTVLKPTKESAAVEMGKLILGWVMIEMG